MAFVAPDPFSAKASVSEADVLADCSVSLAIVSDELVAIDGASVPVAARVSDPSATGPSGPCARKRPAWSWAASSSSTPTLSAGLPRHAPSRYASRSGPPGCSRASQNKLFKSGLGELIDVDSLGSARNDSGSGA